MQEDSLSTNSMKGLVKVVLLLKHTGKSVTFGLRCVHTIKKILKNSLFYGLQLSQKFLTFPSS